MSGENEGDYRVSQQDVNMRDGGTGNALPITGYLEKSQQLETGTDSERPFLACSNSPMRKHFVKPS